jgi:hypothetical protein
MAQNFTTFPAGIGIAQGESILYGASLGVDPNSPDANGTYAVRSHGGTNVIVYAPVPLWSPPSSGYTPEHLGPSVHGGYHFYGLAELAPLPLWTQRSTLGIYAGSILSLENSGTAYDNFYQSGSDHGGGVDPNESANPPWAWLGGYGSCAHLSYTPYYCWYGFVMDDTDITSDRVFWPDSPNPGRLLTNPAGEISLRFPWLPEMTEPVQYNPYITAPPPCCTPQPLAVAINGPDVVNDGSDFTLYANVSGGVAPYTYEWTGPISGSSQSVTTSIYADADFYLDVWDAAGTHVAVTKHVATTGCSGSNLC